MIDLAAEQLIPVSDVPRRLSPRPNGKPVPLKFTDAVYKWTDELLRITQGAWSRLEPEEGEDVVKELTELSEAFRQVLAAGPKEPSDDESDDAVAGWASQRP